MKTLFIPIHRAGWPFIAIFAAITVGLASVSELFGFLGVILTVWCVYFFRDPDRVTPVRDGLVIRPADGVVQLIDHAPPPEELEMGPAPRPPICPSMTVFRAPVTRGPVVSPVSVLS